MIFKIMKASGTFHGVDYNEKKQGQGSAKLIYIENFGHLQDGRENISKDDFKNYFEHYSQRNKRVEMAQFHAMLSTKGKEHSYEDLKNIALQMMDKLGYAENPILIYSHADTANNHIHILTSRVGQDGKKINHNLEGKRSYQILNEILKRDTCQAFIKGKEYALTYNFSTVSQFNMLMELAGYTIKENDKQIEFYKYGTKQGNIDIAKLEQTISENKKMAKDANQLKALIHKYAKQYSPKLREQKKLPFTTANQKFSSVLTDYLKQKFGYQFLFFTAKGQDKPYGYSIIDHKNKTVFKGSEILKLSELQHIHKVNLTQLVNQKNGEPAINDFSNNEVKENEVMTKKEAAPLAVSENGDIPFGNIWEILELLEGNSSSIQQPSGSGGKSPRKKKKKNQFY